MHRDSSAQNPSDYPKRFPVPPDKIKWEVSFPKYDPPYFVAEIVLTNDETKKTSSKNKQWADPEDINLARGLRNFFSYEGVVQFDLKGFPLNPRGRTGISGRGKLGKWGANFAADPIITRKNPKTGKTELLCIQRKDNGRWALPGGMVDRGENASDAAQRELREETGVVLDMSDAIETYHGYVDDPRNTDNAWMETIALHKHLSAEAAKKIHLHAGDDAKKAKWCVLSKRFLNNLYANHAELVQKALSYTK